MTNLGYSGVKNKPFVVLEDTYYTLSNGDKMCVPKGYLTDIASIPKPLRMIFNHISQSDAFIIHDYLYNYRGYKLDPDAFSVIPVSRIFADREMKYQMIKGGANPHRATLYFIAVRLFGWLKFGKI